MKSSESMAQKRHIRVQKTSGHGQAVGFLFWYWFGMIYWCFDLLLLRWRIACKMKRIHTWSNQMQGVMSEMPPWFAVDEWGLCLRIDPTINTRHFSWTHRALYMMMIRTLNTTGENSDVSGRTQISLLMYVWYTVRHLHTEILQYGWLFCPLVWFLKGNVSHCSFEDQIKCF